MQFPEYLQALSRLSACLWRPFRFHSGCSVTFDACGSGAWCCRGAEVNSHKIRCSMKRIAIRRSIAFAIALCISTASPIHATQTAAGTPAPERSKNWTPPAAKLYVQTLTEQIMAAHPELISVTFHGVPPGAAP